MATVPQGDHFSVIATGRHISWAGSLEGPTNICELMDITPQYIKLIPHGS